MPADTQSCLNSEGVDSVKTQALLVALPATSELPLYQCIGLDVVTLVDSVELARTALAALLATDAVGFDTESKPTFKKGEMPTGPHLVQIATDSHAYLFQISCLYGGSELKEILESPRLLKVGFGLGNDLEILKSRLGLAVCNVLDLGEMLRGARHRGTVGAKTAVAHLFGQKLHKSKKTGTSNWANLHLTERQLLYAANDAHVALRIYRAWAHDRPQLE